MISSADIVIADFNPDLVITISCGNKLMLRFGMADLYESVRIHELDNDHCLPAY